MLCGRLKWSTSQTEANSSHPSQVKYLQLLEFLTKVNLLTGWFNPNSHSLGWLTDPPSKAVLDRDQQWVYKIAGLGNLGKASRPIFHMGILDMSLEELGFKRRDGIANQTLIGHTRGSWDSCLSDFNTGGLLFPLCSLTGIHVYQLWTKQVRHFHPLLTSNMEETRWEGILS